MMDFFKFDNHYQIKIYLFYTVYLYFLLLRNVVYKLSHCTQ